MSADILTLNTYIIFKSTRVNQFILCAQFTKSDGSPRHIGVLFDTTGIVNSLDKNCLFKSTTLDNAAVKELTNNTHAFSGWYQLLCGQRECPRTEDYQYEDDMLDWALLRDVIPDIERHLHTKGMFDKVDFPEFLFDEEGEEEEEEEECTYQVYRPGQPPASTSSSTSAASPTAVKPLPRQ